MTREAPVAAINDGNNSKYRRQVIEIQRPAMNVTDIFRQGPASNEA
jgi:hypothetical protein